MKSTRIISTFALLALCGCAKEPPATIRTFLDGAELARICETDASACGGYVYGVIDDMATESETGNALCTNPIRPEVLNAVKNYMRAHPDKLSGWPAPNIVKQAAFDAYGFCGQK